MHTFPSTISKSIPNEHKFHFFIIEYTGSNENEIKESVANVNSWQLFKPV